MILERQRQRRAVSVKGYIIIVYLIMYKVMIILEKLKINKNYLKLEMQFAFNCLELIV